MAVMNMKLAKAWIGQVLGRSGPVSDKTWRCLVDQGLPIGQIGGSPFVSTDAALAWLEAMAGLPLGTRPLPSTATAIVGNAKRGRGRPRKIPR